MKDPQSHRTMTAFLSAALLAALATATARAEYSRRRKVIGNAGIRAE